MTDKDTSTKPLTSSDRCDIKKEVIEILKQLKHLTDKAKKLFSLVEDKK
jgi:hypothetical protein